MKPLLIMGPTGAGKSALALALAERLGGAIVNADAIQVYRDLRALSARPSEEEEARAPHKLYGFVDAATRYSVGQWLDDAMSAIRAARDREQQAIVVGGTGLYFKALTEGLAEAP
ncbi:MAG TPA: isopentenyl transferase family protein, partial [Caulobacterales bacterium]|nr:isopentenyl transferase family protein [Caulobacterales bacterium]